jgi:hypothetical protein
MADNLFEEEPARLRHEIEERWLARLRDAQELHQFAKTESWNILKKFKDGLYAPNDGSFAVQQALSQESAARAEYLRVLRIFTDFTVHSKIPAEE